MQDLRLYIQSGVIENYVMGLASQTEREEFEQLCTKYPELVEARRKFEESLEDYAFRLEATPSKQVRDIIFEKVSGLIDPSPFLTPIPGPDRRPSMWKRLLSWLQQTFEPVSPPQAADPAEPSGPFEVAAPPVGSVIPGPPEAPDPPAPSDPPGPPTPLDPPVPIESPSDNDDNGKLQNATLLKKVLKSPQLMDRLSNRQFEQLAADLVITLGFTAKLTRATKDGGKDIIILHHTEFGDFTFYMECKHTKSKRKVGVDVVRSLLGTITQARVTAGIIITNASFSSEAIRFQQSVVNSVKLIGRDHILCWIDRINQGPSSASCAALL